MSWRVWARITGPSLPATPLRLGNSVVGPAPTGYRPPNVPPPLSLAWPENEFNYFTATAPQLIVSSHCWIIVEGVGGVNEDAAKIWVEENEIPAIVAALSAGQGGQAYRVQIVGADNGNDGYAVSPVIATVGQPNAELEPAELQHAKERVTLTLANKTLATATKLFYRGLRYEDLTAGALSMAASTLAFYQTIEACAKLVAWAPAEDYDKQRAEVVARLRKALGAHTATKKQASAVRTANTALDRLDARFVSLRIEHAARVLDLGAEWVNRERELGKLRNNRLGHPSELPAISELAGWTRTDVDQSLSAYGLASTMLAASFRYLSVSAT